MIMPAHVDVTRAGRSQLRIAHDTQDARTLRLQHINNNHPDATAKDPQSTMSQHRPAPSTRRRMPMLRRISAGAIWRR
jgi:hypothetical protein